MKDEAGKRRNSHKTVTKKATKTATKTATKEATNHAGYAAMTRSFSESNPKRQIRCTPRAREVCA
ncbi:hypothetical protein [Paraburkholderia phenoliruptrix]|uniref:hypothetical protein n=1 Tax=Paraburkholderia phenoliruptrix TaxID=252970 RepID=UPI0002E25DB0|nr:hypothetical protein [Paraburkholderia phenoliruptrix]WMY06677.1 hypothetical protein P3F88_10200 [Paraburkholderia phenoliruptrix]